MKSIDIPTSFHIPFAHDAGSSYINAIPQASQIGIVDGAASLTDGFPPKTFLQAAAGGAGPFGKDFNGILNQVTSWAQWQKSGSPVIYDSSFSTAIGGYPVGAVLASTTVGKLWMSVVDDNTTNPDTGGAGWIAVMTAYSPIFGLYTYGGTANAITVTTGIGLTSIAVGFKITFLASATNTSATTINVDGIGAVVAHTVTGVALPAGYIRTDALTSAIYDGTNWIVDRQAESGGTLASTGGKYVKKADGTLVITGTNVVANCNTAYGSLYRSASIAWVFPVSFQNGLAYSISGLSSIPGAYFAEAGVTYTAAEFDFYIIAPLSVSISSTITYTATGFWY